MVQGAVLPAEDVPPFCFRLHVRHASSSMLSAETAVLLAPAAGVGFYQAEALGRTSRLGWVERRITG